jgi:hypothetical protein
MAQSLSSSSGRLSMLETTTLSRFEIQANELSSLSAILEEHTSDLSQLSLKQSKVEGLCLQVKEVEKKTERTSIELSVFEGEIASLRSQTKEIVREETELRRDQKQLCGQVQSLSATIVRHDNAIREQRESTIEDIWKIQKECEATLRTTRETQLQSESASRGFATLECRLIDLEKRFLQTGPLVCGLFEELVLVSTFTPPLGNCCLSGGIISHLTQACGGNVDDRQRVHISSTSVYDASHAAKNAVDLSTDNYFLSANLADQSITYDFNDNQRISFITHYAIRSFPGVGKNSRIPKSWVVEVLKDRDEGNLWTEIDRRTNNSDLNGRGLIQVFGVSNLRNEAFRRIRFRQIGLNHYGDNCLGFAAFEIYGRLYNRKHTVR